MDAIVFLLGASVGFALGVFGACMLSFSKAFEADDHD